MAREHIYRKVDVRALEHFHDGDGGLSVNAERVWSRLLIDNATTPVPGLVLARRGEMADRCRLALKQFDDAFAELSGFTLDGERDPMALADWPRGVVVLPKAPYQAVHKPRATSEVVEWARFLDRSAARCDLVAELRDRWLAVLAGYGDTWAEAFASQSRGSYAKRSPKHSTKPTDSDSANHSPNHSPNMPANDSPNASQEAGRRTQDAGKKPTAAGARGADQPMDAPDPVSPEAFFRLAWKRQFQQAVDAAAADALFALVDETRRLRGVSLEAFVPPFLAAVTAEFDEQRANGVHRGAITPLHVVDGRHNGAQFARCVQRMDGKHMGSPPPRPDRSNPPTPDLRRGAVPILSREQATAERARREAAGGGKP